MSAGPMRSARIGKFKIVATAFALATMLVACAPPQSVDRIDPAHVEASTPTTPSTTGTEPAAPVIGTASLPTPSSDAGALAGPPDGGITPPGPSVNPPPGPPTTPSPGDPASGAGSDAGNAGGGPKTDAAAAGHDVSTPDSAAIDLAPPPPPPPAIDAGAPVITPPPPPPKWAAIVMGNPLVPTTTDLTIRHHLEARNLKVVLLPDVALANDVAGAALVVISTSCRRFAAFATFRDTTSAFIVMKPSALDDLDMTGPNRSVDYDEQAADDLLILDDRHPLAAGLHGTLAFTQTDAPVGWGHPSAYASRVAGLATVPAKFAIFAYETAAFMLTRPAAGRRIALLIGDRLSDRTDRGPTDGNRLFDAAVDWSLR
jgi:hypothetical protein